MKLRLSALPEKEGLNGFEYMKKYGAWIDEKPKAYESYAKKLSEKELENSFVEDGIVYQKKARKKRRLGLCKGV